MYPLVLVAGATLLFGVALSAFVGAVAARGSSGVPGMSRKVFHISIFSAAVPAHLLGGFWGVVTFGCVIALLVLVAFWHGPGLSLYDGLARASGEELERGEILRPLAATAGGGLVGALLVGDLAVVGYLVCGWGDAMGELVGRRWGRHPYRPPMSRRQDGTRSLEGSLAVALTGWLGAAAALSLLGSHPAEALGAGLVCGVVGAVAEGVSAPGSDNFWVQVLPSLSALWLVG